MTTILFAHRDAEYFAPKLKQAFPSLEVITGLGLIAEALAPRCKAFGMTVLGVSATPRAVEGFDRVYAYPQLAEAAARADFLVVLTPYSPAMDNLIDAKILAAMKPGAYLLNLARGGLCDESALLDALRNQRIAGAGLDVFRTEPCRKTVRTGI